MTKTVILSAADLAIGYGARTLISSISFELPAAQVLCLLGPNGSGKSTLLKTILGLTPKLGGALHVMSRPLEEWKRRDLAQQLAYVPQHSAMSFAFTALEMVLMGRSAYVGVFSAPSAQDKVVAYDCLARLGIEHLAERLFYELSGGEQQLVLLARALAQEPKALILDEPTASLDFANQVLVMEQLQQLRAQGLAIILCTHQPEQAKRLADRVLLLARGQLFAYDEPEQALTIDNLAAIYGLEVEQLRDYLVNENYY